MRKKVLNDHGIFVSIEEYREQKKREKLEKKEYFKFKCSTGEIFEKTKEGYKEFLKSEHWNKMKEKYEHYCKCSKKEIMCECCFITDNLDLHHLNYNNIGNESVHDLVYLCKNCHKGYHEFAGKKLKERTISDYRNFCLENKKHKNKIILRKH